MGLAETVTSFEVGDEPSSGINGASLSPLTEVGAPLGGVKLQREIIEC